MVRKWSYLNPFLTKYSPNLTSPRYLKRIHVIKVFRSRTRFRKRYLSFKTKFTRRTYRRRKHKTSWLLFSHILSMWVRNLLKYRQYLRFYQNLGLLPFQSYSTTLSLVTRVFSKSSTAYNFSMLSCSKKLLLFFENFSSRGHPRLLPKLKGILFTGLLSANLEDLRLNEEVNSGLVECEGFRYPFSTDPKFFTLSLHKSYYTTTLLGISAHVLNYLTIIYSITILLTLRTLQLTTH